MRIFRPAIILFACLFILPARADYIPIFDAHSQLPTPGLAGDVIIIMDTAGVRHVILGFRGSTTMGDVARKQGWPFIIHIELRAVPDREQFMTILERLLADNRDVAFPLIQRAQLDPPDAARLIAAHPNVYFMASHSNPIIVSQSKQPWTDMFAGKQLKPGWRNLLIRHPDRFILNFDNVWPKHWGSYYVEQVALWRKTLAALPPAAAHKIAHKNAERLWKLAP